MGNRTHKSEHKDTRRGVTLCARLMGLGLFMGIAPAPSGFGGGGDRNAVGVGAGMRLRRVIFAQSASDMLPQSGNDKV